MRCVCGQEYEGSSIIPWQSATFDSQGRVMGGTCLHGVVFDFGEFRVGDQVEILKDAPLLSLKGFQGKIKHKALGGEIGVECHTCCYGDVIFWIMPQDLKKVEANEK